MKKLILLLAFIFSVITIAQNEREQNVGDFSTLKAYDLIEVNLIKSTNNKVIISGKNVNDVVLINKKGKLKIRMNLEEIFDGNNTKVELYYSNIEVIDANEGAKIFAKDTIKQHEIELKAQEGGKIIAPLEVTFAEIKANSGGIIETLGKAVKQNISIATGGIYEGRNLETEETEIKIKAGGDGEINATKKVEIKIRAGGNAYIYGDPEVVDESRVFGGRIKYMK